ncbi:MAG: hypothetical protein OXC18_22260 [Desulfurellaceae bacterium]|nr:hypothetical protein [Desulfurellaceae bacterium]
MKMTVRPIHLIAAALSVFIVSCAAQKTPPRVVREKPKLTATSCEEANRLVYKAVQTMGYTIAEYNLARPGQAGRISATKENATDGVVTITCTDNSATIDARNAVNMPSLIGAVERPHHFVNSFPMTYQMVQRREAYETANPETGTLQLTIVPLNNFESQNILGSDMQAGGILPVRVTVQNNTPRPYAIEASKIFLVPESGGRVAPVSSPGGGSALQDMTIEPGQSASGFLYYPVGNYSSARTSVIDKENDEREGFSVQF